MVTAGAGAAAATTARAARMAQRILMLRFLVVGYEYGVAAIRYSRINRKIDWNDC
jgi:hypothetical protein